MAGKAPVMMSEAISMALVGLSKNTLADYAVDLARAEIGEDATDEALLGHIQRRIAPVLAARGDRQIDFLAIYPKCVKTAEKLQAQREQWAKHLSRKEGEL